MSVFSQRIAADMAGHVPTKDTRNQERSNKSDSRKTKLFLWKNYLISSLN